MNWDEKSLEAGEGRFINGNEHIVTYDDQVREEIHVHAFSSGAKWQRDQLRADEAIERLANFLFADDNGESIDQHEKICHDVSKCQLRNGYTQFARAAITALLGEE